MTTQRTLTSDERAAFARDGVIHIRGALDSTWAERMLAAVDRRLDAGASSMGMDRHLYPHDEDFRAFVFDTGLAQLAAQATDSEQVRIYFDQVFVKYGTEDRVFHWHQDHPYWPVSGSQICSTWVALTASTVESSALEFVRGSHAWGITYRPHMPGVTREDLNDKWAGFGDHMMSIPDEMETFEDHPDRFDVVGFDVEPGDALLFDYRIVHRSRGNVSGNRRVAVSYRWLGDDACWSPFVGADPVIGPEHTHLAPGSPVTDDAVFPVVYAKVCTPVTG